MFSLDFSDPSMNSFMNQGQNQPGPHFDFSNNSNQNDGQKWTDTIENFAKPLAGAIHQMNNGHPYGMQPVQRVQGMQGVQPTQGGNQSKSPGFNFPLPPWLQQNNGGGYGNFGGR